MDLPIDLGDVERAAARLEGVAHRTPVVTSRTLDARVGAHLALKAEGFQRMGAFKFRGAYNAVSQLGEDALAAGVVASSSGNHAQALALAASLCRTRATILMPRDAPASKRAATEGYGAEVIEFDRWTDDRDAMTLDVARERGATLIHAYDDPRIMAGAGTCGLELVQDAEGLDVVVVPCGGGGLLSGTLVAVKGLSPGCRVVAVEPEASPDVARSLAAGERVSVEVGRSIADGQLLATPGVRPWQVISALADDAVTVSDDEIRAAMRLLFERCKIVAEPSGASALAAVLAGRVEGERIGVILSGANVDAARFAELLA
ncbi:MAG: serine/threonine dehydratase [Solirubrobacterales bacterium]|nr:serine/threonine dehydratase [Solirubrobacterales bacterium]